VLAALAAVFWGFLWFGLIDLLVVVEQDEQFHEHYLFESGWGLLYLVVVAVPLVVLAVRPGDLIACAQLTVATVAVLLGALWGLALPQLWTGLGLALTVALLAWLGRVRPLQWRRPDPVLAVLAVVGLPPALLYGAPLARNTTEVEDVTNGVSHYPMQASLALAVVGLVALAALTRSRLPAWTAGFSACWLGLESVFYPDLTASLGALGGALTAAWGVIVIVSVEVARRRTANADRRRGESTYR
jgi:hypothetical protein